MREPTPEEGFTLLELVIALAIMSVAVGGLLSVLGAALRTTAVDVHRTDAVALATQELATLRSIAPGTPAPADHQTALNGESFSISDTIAWRRSSGGVDRAYRAFGVVVSWTDQGGAHRIRQETGEVVPSSPGAVATEPCPAPSAAVGPAVIAVRSAAPALQVTWREPSSLAPVVRWEIDTSPDGAAWTAAVPTEQPLAAGATHAVELHGQTPASAYMVRIGSLASCGAATWTAPLTATTAGTPGAACAFGSAAVGPPIVARATSAPQPGALAADVEVVVSTSGPCSGGLWAGVVTSAGAVASTALSRSDSGLYRGVLSGTNQAWDLGRHLVEFFPGTPGAGPLPPSAPLAVAALCVEPAGIASC